MLGLLRRPQAVSRSSISRSRLKNPFKSNVAFDEFRVTAFKELAEAIASRALVDSDVLIRGRLQANNYQKDDKVYYSPELLAEKFVYVVR